MRRFIPLFFAFLSGVVFYSCEENFSPKTDYREKYIFNMLVRADTSFQMATLTKSYSVEGYDPYENHTDPAVYNADIKIWYKDEVYTMRDTLLPRKDASRYSTPIHAYYLKDFKPGANQPLEVKVETNNGRILTASTRVPRTIDFVSIDPIPVPGEKAFTLSWKTYEENLWFLPRLKLQYFIGNTVTPLFITVPLKFKNEQGKNIPVYPVLTSGQSITYTMEVLDAIMTRISEGSPNKGQFYIGGLTLEVFIMDKFMSSYYSVTHGYLDDYSVRLDQADYSNISGGLGIFASYNRQGKLNLLSKQYILKFGYVPYLQ